jgi:hypothetical protein
MADAAERCFDVVLVYHTSRFARNQSEARRYKALLRDRLGIRVVSVTQPIGDDPSDPSFFAESIHEMFDEYYSVSLSFWTRTGLPRRPGKDTLSARFPGDTCATATLGLLSPMRIEPNSCANCSTLRDRPRIGPLARGMAQRPRRAHREGPRLRQGHGSRNARQRRLLRLRLRTPQQRPLRPWTARAAR